MPFKRPIFFLCSHTSTFGSFTQTLRTWWETALAREQLIIVGSFYTVMRKKLAWFYFQQSWQFCFVRLLWSEMICWFAIVWTKLNPIALWWLLGGKKKNKWRVKRIIKVQDRRCDLVPAPWPNATWPWASHCSCPGLRFLQRDTRKLTQVRLVLRWLET